MQDMEQDTAIHALTTLSEAAAASANDLNAIDDDLAAMKRHRRQGWSWRRIVSSTGSVDTLSGVAKIMANLARAAGGFRRALAGALRAEGMQVTEIAGVFDVSRQRVSALTRPRRQADIGTNSPRNE